MNIRLDKKKIITAVIAVLFSLVLTYYMQPFIHGNQDAINIIVTVFSILAGFLVAIITVVGDPSALPRGSWRAARLGSQLTYNRLTRKKWLFTLYLLTLALIFISVLLKGQCPSIEIWLERVYLFIAILAFFLSFQLPSALMKLQQERIEQEIEFRKENASEIEKNSNNF